MHRSGCLAHYFHCVIDNARMSLFRLLYRCGGARARRPSGMNPHPGPAGACYPAVTGASVANRPSIPPSRPYCDLDHIDLIDNALTCVFTSVNSVNGRPVTSRYGERWVNHLCGCLQRWRKRR